MDPVHHRSSQPSPAPPQTFLQTPLPFLPGVLPVQDQGWASQEPPVPSQQRCLSLPPGFLPQTPTENGQSSYFGGTHTTLSTPQQDTHFVGANWVTAPRALQMDPTCGLGDFSTPEFLTQVPHSLEHSSRSAPGNLAGFPGEHQAPITPRGLPVLNRQHQGTPGFQVLSATGLYLEQESRFELPPHEAGSSLVVQSSGSQIPCVHPLVAAPSASEGPQDMTIRVRDPWFHSGIPLASSERGDLHHEIERFSRECLPTGREAEAMDSLLRDLDRRIRRTFPEAHKIKLYGSQATGLALPSSDLDIVILGVGAQIFAPAEHFSSKDRRKVIQRLKHLQHNLERNDYLETGKCKVVEARVPIMKATLRGKDMDFSTDISMGVKNAADAVGLICHHVSQNPMVRPLVLVLKALLRDARLNEVYTGGISSYVLFNLVVAHLMLEGVYNTMESKRGISLDELSTMAERVRFLRFDLGPCTGDLGHLLLGFLERFGDWRNDRNKNLSISIAKGGLCLKQTLNDVNDDCLLCVEDPQASGRNATGGSFKMKAVLDLFKDAAKKLRLALGENGFQKDSSFKILNSIMPCKEMLSRTRAPPEHHHKRKRDGGHSHRRHSSASEKHGSKKAERKRRRTEWISWFEKGS